MKHNFKPGDKARMAKDVLSPRGILFKKGQIVTVKENDQSVVPYLVRIEDGWKEWLNADQLEPIDPTGFQVGDTVYDPVLFPGRDPEVPNPGKVVEVDIDQIYHVRVMFGKENAWYDKDGSYNNNFQPTLSKTPYRFVREEIKWQPKLGEAVLVGDKEGVWLGGVSDGQGKAWVASSFGYTYPLCIPFDPDKVGKPVKP